MTAALQTFELAVGYQSRKYKCPVLENLSLSVQPGELVCLLGPNGIGKSTLLRTLSKIQAPLQGHVEVGGTDLRKLTHLELARRMGAVLTEKVVVGALPAYRVVELGRFPHLGWSGTLNSRDHDVVQWAIEAVGAQHLAARDSSKLSDGERQRFMIARALAQEPMVLLLDEPTAFLDVPSRVELMGLLRHLAREENLAIVISTHDLELALRTGDTLWLVMPGGRLCAGSPEDIVLSGQIAETFKSGNIQFQAEERTFRLLPGKRGKARVRGHGLHATLARAVLEREGYELCGDEDPGAIALCVTISADTPRWEAVAGDRRHQGETFAMLAVVARNP